MSSCFKSVDEKYTLECRNLQARWHLLNRVYQHSAIDFIGARMADSELLCHFDQLSTESFYQV